MLQYTARITSQDTPRVGGRNLFRKGYLSNGIVNKFEVPFDALQPREGDNTYTLSLDYKISPEDKASSPRITCFYAGNKNIFWDSNVVRDGEWHHKEYTIKLDIDESKYPIYGWFTDYGSANGRTIDMVAVRNIKLERGSIATDWTPAPEDVEESVTSLESKLLDPTTGEIHKLTSQLTTSAQQTLAEAVKRAGEMDKQIKVGGRNLIVKDRYDPEPSETTEDYLYRRLILSRKHTFVTGDWYTLSMDVQVPEDAKGLGSYNIFDWNGRINKYGGQGDPRIVIHNGRNHITFKWGEAGNKLSNTGLLLYRGFSYSEHPQDFPKYPITTSNITLVKGTIGLESYVPAPEDLDDRISNVSTSLTSLASTLLDPNEGDIPQLFRQLDKHKTDTDKSFAELNDHPLTIDDNGYWQVWSVKDSKYLTTQYQSRGRDGRNGTDGKDGHTPVINWDGTKLIIDDKAPVDLRGQRGEPGHSPSPGAVLNNPQFRQLLGDEVTTKVTPFSDRIDEVKTTADQARTDLDTANTKLDDLDQRSLTTEQKRDLGYLTYSLQTLKSGSNGTLEGLTLQRYIALSGDNQTVSAYLASNALPAVLKAGITGFGTPNEREQVEITHAGTGHIGNLYFAGDQIDFRTSQTSDPYLSIGAEESVFIDTFLSQARLDDTPVSVSSVSLTARNAGYQRTISVDNDGTRLTINLDKVNVAVYGLSWLRLTLDGVTLAEWQGKTTYTDAKGGSNFKVEYTPYEASNLTYERVVRAGNHIVRLAVVNPTSGQAASVTGLRVRRRYDTGAQQSVLTKSGLRLFGSPDRYFDVDYRKEYMRKISSIDTPLPFPNPYLVRIKGGAKIDKLTADELDMPGVPLCGATFDEGGGQINSFGAKAKQQGYTHAQAYRAYNADFYRVYHSIGHKRYIPVLQVYGLSNNNHTQCLTTRIDAIEANSFAVRIVTTGNVSIKHSFSYVAFKTT